MSRSRFLLSRPRISLSLLAWALASAGLALPATAAAPAAATLESLGKCLMPSAAADGAPVVIAACSESSSQRWQLPPRGFSGPIVNSSGQCLDVFGGHSEDETPIIVFSCHGLPNQTWRHEVDGRIVGLADKCLDVQQSQPADGTPLILFRCHPDHPTANQIWRASQLNFFHSEALTSEVRLLGLASSPALPNRIFAAGGPNGVLRSENIGVDWAGAHSGVSLRAGIEQVVVDPLQADHVYALEKGRLLRSTDGGRHFLSVPPTARLRGLAADPRRAGHLLALDGTRFYESFDGGSYFTPRDFPVQQSPDTLQQMVFDPLVPDRLFIAAAATCAFCTGPDQGVFRSTDGGASWARTLVQPTQRVVADPRSAGQVYALVAKQVYRSTDGGASWQLLAGFAGRVLDLWVDGQHPGIVMVSHEQGLARSVDGGASFAPVDIGLRTGTNGLPAEFVSSFLLAGPLLAAVDATDGHPGRGLIMSPDLGATWVPWSRRGFAAGKIVDIDPSPGFPEEMWVTSREGIFATSDGGDYYTRRLATTGPASATALLVDPFDFSGNTLYAAASRAAGAPGPFIWKSTDHGLTWRGVASADGQPIKTGGFVAVSRSGTRVYLTTFEGEIAGNSIRGFLRSDDDGATWKPIDIGQKVWLLAKHGHGVIYAGGESLWRSVDEGLTWQAMPGSNADAIAAGEGDDVFAVNQTTFYASSNLGVDFDAYELPAAISQPSALIVDGIWMYLGDRAGGVFASLDRGRSWTALDRGLPASGVQALFVGGSTYPPLWVGTEGAGLYRAPTSPETAPLKLGGDRFSATIAWKDFAGATGRGPAAAWTEDSGYFWFFLPNNVELMVKVLDGRLINGSYWVFVGSLSNVEFELKVRDEWTGRERVYRNPLGSFASFGDIDAFPETLGLAAGLPLAAAAPAPEYVSAPAAAASLNALPASLPAPATSQVVTVRGRFEIRAEWEDDIGQFGHAFGRQMTEDTAAFNFFSATNTELVIKVLDGTSINGHNWVFYGALSDVGYVITIRDLETGEQAVYHNPVGQFGSVGDIEAF